MRDNNGFYEGLRGELQRELLDWQGDITTSATDSDFDEIVNLNRKNMDVVLDNIESLIREKQKEAATKAIKHVYDMLHDVDKDEADKYLEQLEEVKQKPAPRTGRSYYDPRWGGLKEK